MLILCVCTNPKISTAVLKPKNVHSCAQPKIYGKKTVLAAQAVLNFEPKELAQLLLAPLAVLL